MKKRKNRLLESKMEGIVHRTVEVNGIKMHVAEKGVEGPVVVLLHGFPELWYSWRHQIIGLADNGYRAVAPDLRGYGDTDAPPSTGDYSIFSMVADVVALIDSLGQDQVFVVGHDWGAVVAWYLCMFRPDKVKALVNLSTPITPRNPAAKPIDSIRHLFGDQHYITRFQEPGAVEAEFARLGTEVVFRKFFTYRTPGPLFIPREGWGSPNEQIALPSWISEEDVNYYTRKFEKAGFSGGMNYYRNLDLNWELTAPWTGAKIKVPTKFIIGDLDLTYHIPGIQDFIHKGGFKRYAPLLEEVVVMPGVAHWINQEKPQEITDHILAFLAKF